MCAFSGCITVDKKCWTVPEKPDLKKVEFIPINNANIEKNGYYLSYTNAMMLANNVDELKAYIEKLEVLTDMIIKHYGDKKLEK